MAYWPFSAGLSEIMYRLQTGTVVKSREQPISARLPAPDLNARTISDIHEIAAVISFVEPAVSFSAQGRPQGHTLDLQNLGALAVF